MPSIKHEGLLQPFQHRPSLAAELLTDALGVKLPDWRQARLGSSDLTDLVPTEYRADTVVELYRGAAPLGPAPPRGPAETPVQAVILEVQKDKDARKRYSWPVYLATLRARLKCPTVLLVVCPHPTAATWCAEPIELGHPNWVLTPLVLGPDQTPVITDPEQAARSPELSVLSALAHGASHPRGYQVLDAFTGALRAVDRDRATVYHDVVSATLSKAARRYLERLMSTGTYQFQSEFALRHIAQGKAEGKAEGEAHALLTVLASRGVDVPAQARDRITTCRDLDQFDRWLRRAATADSVDDLFVD